MDCSDLVVEDSLKKKVDKNSKESPIEQPWTVCSESAAEHVQRTVALTGHGLQAEVLLYL